MSNSLTESLREELGLNATDEKVASLDEALVGVGEDVAELKETKAQYATKAALEALASELEELKRRVDQPQPSPEPPPAPTLSVSIDGIVADEKVSGSRPVVAVVDSDADIAEVRFLIDGKLERVERVEPYSLASDSGGNINSFNFSDLDLGVHWLTAVARTTDGSTRTAAVKFEVVKETVPPTPKPPQNDHPSIYDQRIVEVIALDAGPNDLSKYPFKWRNGGYTVLAPKYGVGYLESSVTAMPRRIEGWLATDGVLIESPPHRMFYGQGDARVWFENTYYIGVEPTKDRYTDQTTQAFRLVTWVNSTIDRVSMPLWNNQGGEIHAYGVEIPNVYEDAIRNKGIYRDIRIGKCGVTRVGNKPHSDVVQSIGDTGLMRVDIDGLTVDEMVSYGIVGGYTGSIRNVKMPKSGSSHHAGMQLTHPCRDLLVKDCEFGGPIRLRYDIKFTAENVVFDGVSPRAPAGRGVTIKQPMH